MQKFKIFVLTATLLSMSSRLYSQVNLDDKQVSDVQRSENASLPVQSAYLLGPDDQISVEVLNADEVSSKSVPVDKDGDIHLQLIGRVKAEGKTTTELEKAIAEQLRKEIRDPQIVVNVTEFRSQPVSVMGAVQKPGIIYLEGRRSLLETLSLAGGLKAEAGAKISIVRPTSSGLLPVGLRRVFANGKYSSAEIPIKALLNGTRPDLNFPIVKGDTITVPQADYVYVVGEVLRAGAFPINESGRMSVVQAIALAGGINTTSAAAGRTVILMHDPATGSKSEKIVNLKKLLGTNAEETELGPQDVVYVPSSTGKKVALRAIEAMIQAGTGIAIWQSANR